MNYSTTKSVRLRVTRNLVRNLEKTARHAVITFAVKSFWVTVVESWANFYAVFASANVETLN